MILHQCCAKDFFPFVFLATFFTTLITLTFILFLYFHNFVIFVLFFQQKIFFNVVVSIGVFLVFFCAFSFNSIPFPISYLFKNHSLFSVQFLWSNMLHPQNLSSIHELYFLRHAAYFLDDVMLAFEKIRGLVIQDWYFSGKMETLGTKRKVEQKYAACLKK